jgi:hypothetical protein
MNTSRDLSARWPLILLILALIALAHRLLLGEVFVWGLPSLQFYPWRIEALDMLLGGQLPLWSFFNGAGAPLFANYQSALLYPLGWLSFILPSPWALSLTAAAHLFLAGWGMWMFTGSFGWGALGRGLSALAFGMTTYLMARLGTFPMIHAAAWLPWLMWTAHALITRGRHKDAAWLALFTAMQLLAGHAQTAWYSLLLTGLFSLWLLARTRPFRWSVLIGLVGAVLLGAGVAAVQLAGTAELLLSSQRAAGVEASFAMNFSYHPLRTLNLITPNFFGTPADGSYIPDGAFFEDAVYIGLIPLVSACAAVLGWIRARGKKQNLPALVHIPFWLLIVVVAFIFAMGQYGPVFPFLYDNIPTFNLFQAPVRWHLWTVFGLAVMAGAGAAVWGRDLRARRWSRRLTAVCAAGLLVGGMGSLALQETQPELAIMLGSIAITGLIGVLAGGLSAARPDNADSRYPRWALLVLVLVSADLIWANWGLNPTTSASFDQAQAVAAQTRAYWPPQAEEIIRFDTYFRFDDYRVTLERWAKARASGLPNLNILDRTYLLNNFDPLVPGRYQDFMHLIATQSQVEANLLRAAGVAAQYDTTGNLIPLHNGAVRAWLVSDACWHATDADMTRALLADSWNPQAQVHLAGDGDCRAADDDPAPPGQIIALEDVANGTTITVETERPGWLLLADVHYPGWRAEVDGTPVVIERANLAFRAVALPAGARTVRFVYEPGWIVPGAVISGIALLVLLVLFRTSTPEYT